MSEQNVEALIARGTLRRVEADPGLARAELATARKHLDTAESSRDEDEVAALAVAYEGARKAITAHMRARGLRAVGGEGAQARVGEYAQAALDDPDLASHLRAFDRMRRLRNRSQYDALPVDDADVGYALEHARAIVEAVEADLA